MNTFSRYGFIAAIMGAAALTCPASHAAPSAPEAAALQPAPQLTRKKNCLQTVQAALDTRDGSFGLGRVGVPDSAGLMRWYDANQRQRSTHLDRVLLGSDEADLDGFRNPCRLLDNDEEHEYFVREGVYQDVLAALGKLLADDGLEQDDEAQEAANRARFKHRKIADGRPKSAPRHDADSADTGLGTGKGKGHPELQTLDTGNVAAVPEPESYLMLLAGLGLIGTLARLKRRR